MVPSKLGVVCEPPLSPSTYDSNPETENSIVMHDFVVPNNVIDASEVNGLDTLYDNAVDDGPMMLEEPPWLTIVSDTCEDLIKIIHLMFRMILSFMKTLYLILLITP
jgi:hypothetical protein